MAQRIDLARFYLGEAVRLSDVAKVSEETAQAVALRCWLLDRWPDLARSIDRNPATITPREAVLYGPNALRETRVVRRLMAVLADLGWLVNLPKGEAVGGSPGRWLSALCNRTEKRHE